MLHRRSFLPDEMDEEKAEEFKAFRGEVSEALAYSSFFLKDVGATELFAILQSSLHAWPEWRVLEAALFCVAAAGITTSF